jgi:hypothetical protein
MRRRITGLASIAIPITGRFGRAALRISSGSCRPGIDRYFEGPGVPEVAPDIDATETSRRAFRSGLARLNNRINKPCELAFLYLPRELAGFQTLALEFTPVIDHIENRKAALGASERPLHTLDELSNRRFLQLPIPTRAQGAADPLLDFLARYAWPWFQTRRLQSYSIYSDLEIPTLLDQIRYEQARRAQH